MKTHVAVALGVIVCASPCIQAQSDVRTVQTSGSSSHFNLNEYPNAAHGTVNVGLALSEGLVLAADSRLTLVTTQTFPGYMVLSDNNTKLFAIDNIGISTYGEAFLSNRTIASWVADYAAKQHQKMDDVMAFSKRFSEYFGKLYDENSAATKTKPTLGFYIAGYDTNGDGKLLIMEFPNQREPVEAKNTKNKQGAQWSGDIEAINRLEKGFDPRFGLLPFWNTLTPEQKTEAGKEIGNLEYAIPWQALMLQDGVDSQQP